MPAGAWDGTIAAVVGGMVGAVTGGLTSWAVSHYSATKARSAAKIDQLEVLVDSFREVSMSYWRTSGRNDALERLIITKLDALGSKLELLKSRKHISASSYEAAEEARSELFDEATGGTFQTKNRTVDSEKVARIKALCDKLLAST